MNRIKNQHHYSDRRQQPRRSRQPNREEKYIHEPIKTVNGQTIIKKYIKIKLVGQGAYSKCYLVKNVDSDSTYVVKILPKKKLQVLIREKLVYQIKIHQSLVHPYIVYFDHWFQDQKYQYIFLQYCPNGNLQDKLENMEAMPENMIRRYARQIVEVIAYIHSQKVLHRDLKLCNFYLDHNQDIKLGDFGFACQLANEHDRKRQTCGTPNYIAPEAISGFGYTFSSDVWAIGVILFKMKFNSCPFEGQTVKKTLQNVKTCNYTMPKFKKISKELKDLIQKIFTLNYDDRLTPQQILAHKFFSDEGQSRKSPQVKRGFSLTRLFSFDKEEKNGKQKNSKNTKKVQDSRSRDRRGMMQRQTRAVSQHQPNKRSNSCETFKQIKQIFKNKSKPTLVTNSNLNTNANSRSQMSSLATSNNGSGTIRENTSFSGYTSTNRSYLQNNLNLLTSVNDGSNVFSRKEEVSKNSRTSKLNDFINSQMHSIPIKQQIKKGITNNSQHGQGILNIRSNKGQAKTKNNYLILQSHQKQIQHLNYLLSTAQKRYFLPSKIQQQRDIYIISYRDDLKQIIQSNTSYIIYINKFCVYSITGQPININQLPRLLKHVIQNKISLQKRQIKEDDDQYIDSQQFRQQQLQKILVHLPHRWVITKQGLILKYGYSGNFLVGKIDSAESFYVYQEQNQTTTNVSGKQKKQRKKNNFMFNNINNQYKIAQGVVNQNYYHTWITMNINGKKQK